MQGTSGAGGIGLGPGAMMSEGAGPDRERRRSAGVGRSPTSAFAPYGPPRPFRSHDLPSAASQRRKAVGGAGEAWMGSGHGSGPGSAFVVNPSPMTVAAGVQNQLRSAAPAKEGGAAGAAASAPPPDDEDHGLPPIRVPRRFSLEEAGRQPPQDPAAAAQQPLPGFTHPAAAEAAAAAAAAPAHVHSPRRNEAAASGAGGGFGSPGDANWSASFFSANKPRSPGLAGSQQAAAGLLGQARDLFNLGRGAARGSLGGRGGLGAGFVLSGDAGGPRTVPNSVDSGTGSPETARGRDSAAGAAGMEDGGWPTMPATR